MGIKEVLLVVGWLSCFFSFRSFSNYFAHVGFKRDFFRTITFVIEQFFRIISQYTMHMKLWIMYLIKFMLANGPKDIFDVDVKFLL